MITLQNGFIADQASKKNKKKKQTQANNNNKKKHIKDTQ